MELIFGSLCVKEVAELQKFRNQPKHNWDCRLDEVTECGDTLLGGKIVSPYPPPKISSTGTFCVRSTASEEHSLKEIMQ